MRLIRVLATCAALAVAAAARADDPKPAPTEEVFSKAFATPRYYALAATGDMAEQNGIKMCMDGESVRKMFAVIQQFTKDPAMAGLSKGCSRKVERGPNGYVSSEMVCDAAAGATMPGRTTVSGTPAEMHQHIEMTLKGFGKDGGDKLFVTDTTMTYVGDCPSNVKPGQIVDRDGKVSDPLAALLDAGAKSSAPKGATAAPK